MRRRSTFIPSPGVDFNPSEINIERHSLTFTGLKAAREERLTFGLDKLPPEIIELLQASHQLHVRWVSEQAYEKTAPFVSALNPGLHVHCTPLKQGNQQLCPLLHALFSPSLPCTTMGASFSRPHLISERFAHAASLQYYSLLPSLGNLVAYIQRNTCPPSDTICAHNAAILNIASYVDIDYDSISHTLTLTAFWSKPPAVLMDPIGEWTTYDHWNLALTASPKDKNEVGILRTTAASDPQELQIEGFLAVIGEDKEPKPTMFFFPSRHHVLEPSQAQQQMYTVSFEQPTGLHPKMRISLPSALQLKEPTNKPQDSTCALHTYLTLPSVLFADEYAFPTLEHPDPLFTEAHNILSLRSLSGERDLEAPDYATSKWGSAILLELATPTNSVHESTWNITLPLHLRYLAPNVGGVETVKIPHPILFWACTADEGTKFTVNPFDRVNLGYDGLFGPRTMFYHLDPAPSSTDRLVESIDVPVLDTTYLGHTLVELLTMAFVVMGFLWVASRVLREVRWEMSWWAKHDQKDKQKKAQ
ncbi:protease B nonderepressible form [Neophaeococcomyces mojaviensis]|uniref:Protease B nonderepressible form n=1 Tax=Neophaeococcomyces mojaviensis TaxID=3383035 RepID=A0ACC3AEU3_9EURO|nr:protease B nonderepressible form [Knufia sp. JES_112]